MLIKIKFIYFVQGKNEILSLGRSMGAEYWIFQAQEGLRMEKNEAPELGKA